jgi:phage head maturation protease
VAGAERLHQYWVHGEGAAKIRWGTPGDFDRCTQQLEEHAHFTPEQAHGYCNLAHHAATGMYPATHAALEHGHRSAAMADSSKPYGDVTYADPGYQKDGKKRYPIDTAEHVRAAWSYINQADNAAQYTAEQLAAIKGRIRAAAKRLGVEIAADSGGRSAAVMNVEWRSATVDDVNRRQRIITVIAIPYEEEGTAFYRGEVWNEVHHRGAYRGVDLSAGRVPILVEHDPKIQLGKAANIDPDHASGLLARMKISDPGEMGERYLALAEDDAVSASVGFYLKSNADQRLNRRTMLREINRAFLDHIALVGQPAYAGAKVLSVASDEQQKTAADLPRLDTPKLDAILNDELFQWAAQQS